MSAVSKEKDKISSAGRSFLIACVFCCKAFVKVFTIAECEKNGKLYTKRRVALTEKKKFAKILILLICLLLIGALSCAVIFLAPLNFNTYYISSFVNSELIYFMLGLCALVAISLVWMLFVCFGATRYTRKTLKKVGGTKSQKARRSKRKKVEGRFSMLSKIDKKMSSYNLPRQKNIKL